MYAVMDLDNATKGAIAFSGTPCGVELKGKRLPRHRRRLPGLEEQERRAADIQLRIADWMLFIEKAGR
jgi:hypothetical protein